MIRLLKKYMPLVLALVLVIGYWLSNSLSQRYLVYAVNLGFLIKDILMLVLPLIVFGCLSQAITKIGSKVITKIPLIIILLCISNYISTLVAYFCTNYLFNNIFGVTSFASQKTELLKPTWLLNFPNLIKNQYAMLLACILGILNIYIPTKVTTSIIKNSYKLAMFFLDKIFVILLPFFIFGFGIKMFYEGTLAEFLQNNNQQFYYMIFILFAYLLLITALIAGFRLRKAYKIISNTTPAVFTAFSTMSSAAAMPYSLKAAQKNTKGNPLADIAVPTTVNFHLVGDSICIPILAIILLAMNNQAAPDIFLYAKFALSFVLAKFAVAAVPAGGILVMLPILQQFFGFTASMSATITAIYIFLDPIITMANVFGNNLFTLVLCKIDNKISKI